MELKLKICGLRDEDNIRQIAGLSPDYMGFITYPKSPRYFFADSPHADLSIIPGDIRKTGVVVDTAIEEVFVLKNQLGLDAIQFHGNESPELCRSAMEIGLEVIKAFGITDDFDFKELDKYDQYVDLFLFDSVGGGTGRKFRWDLLKQYRGSKPFFIGGGVDTDSLRELHELDGLPLAGIDVNSRFEIRPGYKDINKLKELISALDKLNNEQAA